MAKLSDFFFKRLQTKEVATMSSPFHSSLRSIELSHAEQAELADLLEEYHYNTQSASDADLQALMAITAEVKAINNQAIILHGERIKRAQQILASYRDGAFSTWLMITYGNRQTPYNFLQYFEFYTSLKEELKKHIDQMPRQVIYTLASRPAPAEKKTQFIESYQGRSKKELLALIRKEFPIAPTDGRREKVSPKVVKALEHAIALAHKRTFVPSAEDKQKILSLLDILRQTLA